MTQGGFEVLLKHRKIEKKKARNQDWVFLWMWQHWEMPQRRTEGCLWQESPVVVAKQEHLNPGPSSPGLGTAGVWV